MRVHTLLLLLLSAPCALAQTQEPARKPDTPEQVEVIEEIEDVEVAAPASLWASNNYPVMERTINVATARTMRKRGLLFLIEHRTRQPLRDEPFQDLLGFDAGGLKIGLGLRYGVLDNLETGFYRMNGTVEVFDTWEFDAKYRWLNENTAPLGAAVRFGVTWFAQAHADDAAGVFGQMLFGKTFGGTASAGTGVLWHSNSSSDRKSLADKEYSVAIPAQLELRLTPHWTWNVEVVSNVAGYGEAHPVVASSFKRLTHRHSFALVVSNTQYMSADGMVANTGRRFKDAVLGFTITREIGL